MTSGLTIRLLGPVRVDRGAEIVESGPPQQQATLAVLAVNAGTPTPVEQIAAAIWGDRQPSSAHGTVRTCVYRLRKILSGDGAGIESSSQGYLLRAAPGVIDLHRFTALVDEARALPDNATQDRADRLRRAIDLWRGDAFAGLCGEYFDDRRTRLAAERFTAVQDWCEAALELDQADRTVASLHELIAIDPFQERSHELLMLALVRLGQRAEALEVYDRIRRRLADELGIDPGPRLQALHERVLHSDATLLRAPEPAEEAYTPIPAQLPSDLMAFSGRDDEVADAVETAAPITLIHGTAGVGKTTLAVHVAHQMAADYPDGQLFINLQGFYRNMSPVPPGMAIRSLLEGLGIPAAQVPDDLPAQTAYYRSVMAGRRCLIVLDNARDSEQVLPLLPGNAGCAVIVTTRTMLTQLVMATGAHIIQLDLLSPAAAEHFLRARLGSRRVDAEPAAVRQIVAKCARLPLALAITAARAALRPRLPLAGIVDLANRQRRDHIMTVEDPIEFLHQHKRSIVNQREIGSDAPDFALGLRAALRQDPDVILVGEIRDQETAEMAFRAAMTGHQVYSTLHTNSAAGAFPRLLDIGIVPDILAGNIIGILAQRLVRKLCRTCRQSYDPDVRERRLLGVTPTEPIALFRAVGCEQCDYQGYKGRQSILELLKIDGGIDELIARRATAREILTAARASGFKTLADDGVRLVKAGVTGLDELMRVVDLTDRMA